MITSLLLLFFSGPVRAEGWQPSLPKALAEAQASKRRVLVDFTAPWCYSCYYMDKNVFDRASFWDAVKGVVLARIDVDQPEGRALKEQRRVRFLPTFLVLEADGREVGRILGEQREAEFLSQLQALLRTGKRGAEDEAVAKLEAALARDDSEKAAGLVAKPAPASAQALAGRADWRKLALRARLRRKPSAEALAAMAELNDGCDFAYDLDAGLKGRPSREALQALRTRLDAWYERRYWVPGRDRCADFRSGVEAMADFYEVAGDTAAKAATLDRAAILSSSESDRAGVGSDRNLDDNRRFFLDAAGRDGDLEALYPRLIEAYPSDYVYAYRYAKWLAAKKRDAEALPLVEKAARLCYGANRLQVTQLQAEILGRLNRKPEAQALLRRELRAYGAKLPKEVKPLRDLLGSLSSGKQ